MHPIRLRHLLPAALVALLGLTNSANAQVAAFYALTDLGTIPGGSESVAYGISPLGTVVGYSTIAGGTRQAVQWVGGVPVAIPLANLPGDTFSEARAVNAAGVVVGFSSTGMVAGNSVGDEAVSWTATLPTNLGITSAAAFTGATPAFTGSRAQDISPGGEIVGHAFSGVFGNLTAADGLRGFYRSAGGAITRLEPTSGSVNYPVDAALSYGMNSSGQVFGQSDPGGTGAGFRASRWSNPSGSAVTPFTYPTAAGNPALTEYLGFTGNNLNRIVGTAITSTFSQSQAFAADTAIGSTLLSNIGGGLFGFANAINNGAVNLIVGGVNTDTSAGGNEHAVAWEWPTGAPSPNVVPFDLNGRLASNPNGMVLVEAFDINDLGQIVGMGLVGGNLHAFLLTPVPEPGTLALCGAGLGGLLIRTWRRRKSVA